MKNATFVLAALALTWGAVDACPAQEETSVREAERFLDILQPGQRVQGRQIGDSPVTAGFVITLVSEEQWAEIERLAPEREAKIESLENLRESIASDMQEISSFGNRDDAPRPTRNSQNLYRELVTQEQEALQEMTQLRRQLPNAYGEVRIVGDDYIAVESAKKIEYFPASRIVKIEQLKKVESAASDEEATERPETPSSEETPPSEPATATDAAPASDEQQK